MNSKFLFPIISLLSIFIMGVFFVLNPSYEKSLEAKFYYETGDFEEAYALSQEAFELDKYNRMASTIMAQSTTSLKYTAYLKDGRKYIKIIDEIASHDIISDADKAKIKIICEIMVGNYVKLAPSIITDDYLVEEAAKYKDKFEKLLVKVTK